MVWLKFAIQEIISIVTTWEFATPMEPHAIALILRLDGLLTAAVRIMMAQCYYQGKFALQVTKIVIVIMKESVILSGLDVFASTIIGGGQKDVLHGIALYSSIIFLFLMKILQVF